jgi:predicted nucleotidyltransferase
MALKSLRRYRREILDAAERHGARNVPVFGSIARGDDQFCDLFIENVKRLMAR